MRNIYAVLIGLLVALIAFLNSSFAVQVLYGVTAIVVLLDMKRRQHRDD